MYDPTLPFTQEEITSIEGAGLTIGEVRDHFSRFPDESLDAAIGGTIMEKKAKEAGLTTGLEADRTVNSDVPAPAESGPEASKLSEETSTTE